MMHRTTIVGLLAAGLAGAALATASLDARAASSDVRAVVEAARTAVASTATAHCEVPCGIYDDHAEVERMRLDAITMKKASAQITTLADSVDAASLNTIARWAMIKEEHGRKLQHTVAWYFLTQRVKAPKDMNDAVAVEKYHGQLAAFHRVSVAAMKAAQNLDPASTDELLAAIDVVAPWYPAPKAGADATATSELQHLALESDTWRAAP
jgi:nickel superoxide dismutase